MGGRQGNASSLGWSGRKSFFLTSDHSFHYYVDSRNGNDANDGTTPDTAFATLAVAAAAVVSAGNGTRLGLRYGSHWREELDLDALSGVTIEAYGSKADGLPIIDGSDVIDGTWADSTDRADAYTNTYSISWSHSISAGSQNGGPVVTQDGEILIWKSSIASVDATPGSFYHDGATSDESPVTLYVHPRNSGDPSSGLFEATKRDWCVRHRTGANFRAKHIHVKNPGQSLGGLVFGENGYVEGILSSACFIHDILGASGTMRKCVSWHPHFTNGFGAIAQEFFAETATGLTGRWEKCIVRGPTDLPGTEGCAAFGGHSSDSSKYDSWTVIDCSVEGSSVDFSTDVLAYEVTRTSIKNGSLLINDSGGTADGFITDLQLIVTGSVWASRNYGIAQVGTGHDLYIDGLRAVMPANLNPIVSGPKNVVLTNSIMVLTGTGTTGAAVSAPSDVNVENISMSGCIIDAGGNTLMNMNGYLTPSGSLTSDNNVLYGWGNYKMDQAVGANKTYTSLATLKAGESVEANSIEVDPQIADPVNGNWTVGGTVGGAGLTRPNITYLPIPASLAAAEAWILANS